MSGYCCIFAKRLGKWGVGSLQAGSERRANGGATRRGGGDSMGGSGFIPRPLQLLSHLRPSGLPQSPLPPTHLGFKPQRHMSILLGVEPQIPIDVAELRFQPLSVQLSQSSLNYFHNWFLRLPRNDEYSESQSLPYVTPWNESR
ncbi:hypothetical protein EYF80_039158 [Liparis tanakae]|uniref:Uncharacterized protein n=1 Tax=Liparis tanakae TaxID=230148 RepID=A0A4Z2GC06_9TELE|nr:hypothetical protein EYF80_039158 [Liparis tanakae]